MIDAAYSDAVMLQSPGVATNSSPRLVPVQVNQLRQTIYTRFIVDQIAILVEPNAGR